MSIFKSGNPILNKELDGTIFAGLSTDGTMSAKSTMQKFGVLFLLTIISAAFSFKYMDAGNVPSSMLMVTGIVSLVIAITLYFKQKWANFLGPIYAITKGSFVGILTYIYGGLFDGIVAQALLLTFGVVISMYLLYNFKIIRATQKFKAIVGTATLGIAVFYLINFGLHLLGINIPYIHESGMIGIGFSLFVVALAALNLIIDFDMIENGAANGLSKKYEWFLAFGLLVTIIWLYIEILRLLSKLRD